MTGEIAEIALMMNNLRVEGDSTDRLDQSVASLVERAKAGDSTAFDQIIACYQRRVVATAWRALGNREDARDAAQEVFLRVYKYLSRYKADQDFSGWLYRITMNVCHDIARKRGSRERFTSFESERQLGRIEQVASGEDVEAAAIRSQQQAIIANALETLSTKERAAIVLRDMEGLSTEEVARILDSSQTTVRSQICSARAKIKQYRDRVLKRGRRE